MRSHAVLLALVLAAGPAAAAAEAKPVAKPRFVRTIATGETGWFASPGLVDLDGDRRLEIVAPSYSTSVFDARGRLLGKGTATSGRVYAPGVVADLDGDGTREIVVGGNDGTVAAYVLAGGELRLKAGLARVHVQRRAVPRGARDGRGRPRRRRARRGRRDHDEHGADRLPGLRLRRLRRAVPPGGRARGGVAPLQHALGPGGDAAFNGVGNQGYGAYGENVGIGQLDDDPQLELVVTFDNHQINLFNHDGTSVLASPWFTNRQSGHVGARLGWGQFIRWLSPRVERDHYHRHAGPVARCPHDAVAAVDGLAAVDRRSGRRRPQRGDRAAERGAQGAVRDAGLCVHGARRRLRQRGAVGAPAQGLPAAAALAQAGRAPRRRLLPAERDPRADARGPARRPPSRDRRRRPRRGGVRGRADRQAAVAVRLRPRRGEDVRLRGRGRRPEPRRADRARLRHLRPAGRGRPARRPLRVRPPAPRPPAAPPGRRRERHRRARRALDRRPRRRPPAGDRAHHVRPRARRLPRPRSRPNRLPWPTGRGSLLRAGTG